MNKIILLIFGGLVAVTASAQKPARTVGQKSAAARDLPDVPADLNLVQAEKLLWDRNLSIITNRYQLDANEAARRIAGYKPNPYLQLGMEQVVVYSPLAGSYPRFVETNSNAGANPVYTALFNKTFERGGKREFRVEQADRVVAAARVQILDTYRTQVFLLREAFASAFLARDNLSMARDMDANYQKVQDLTETRVKVGSLAKVEMFRIRAGHLQYSQAIVDAQNAYEQAAQDILNLLNARPPDAPSTTSQIVYGPPGEKAAEVLAPDSVSVLRAGPTINILGSFTDASLPQTLDQIREIALKQRPDVQQARENLLAAKAATKIARAQRKRDLSIGVEYQHVGDDSSVGIVAQIPLFLYNNQQAGIVQALAQQSAAEVQLRQAEIQAVTDVQKGYQSYLSARQSLDLFTKENLTQVAQLRDVAEFSFGHGATSLFELLDVERTVLQSRTSYNQARQNYQVAIWQLEEAAGQALIP